MSGFLFNHNSTIWGGNVETLASFTSEQIISENSIQPIKLDEQMTRVLAEINSANDSNYTLDGSPWLSGHLALEAQAGKPTRVIGAVSVFAAAIIAFYIFAGTLDDYTHIPVQIRSR